MLNPLRTWHFESCSTLKPKELAEHFRTALGLDDYRDGLSEGRWVSDPDSEVESFELTSRLPQFKDSFFSSERVQLKGRIFRTSKGTAIHITVKVPWKNWQHVLIGAFGAALALRLLIGGVFPLVILGVLALVLPATSCVALGISLQARRMALARVEKLFPGEWKRLEGHRG